MWHVPFFRIFYSTSFTVLLLITFGLLAVSPIDIALYAFRDGQQWSIIIIAGVYVLVFLVTLFIYATRLYTTRTHLASIPKSRLPLQEGDLPGSVYRHVVTGIERSASIAFRARPRNLSREEWQTSEVNATRRRPDAEPTPTWGNVSHPGCSPPHDPEAPDLQYEHVIQELPHLLEARAVSLAPPDPLFVEQPDEEQDQEQTHPPPDPRAVNLLQRLPSMSLRSYIAQLANLEVLDSIEQAADFVQRYEVARFADKQLNEVEFRSLMQSFALVLDTMREPDPYSIADMMDGNGSISAASGRRSETSALLNNNPSQVSLSIRHQWSVASLVTHSTSGSSIRDQSRLQARRTHDASSSLNESEDYATPGLTPGMQTNTPFYTPYPIGTSARTTSTGSLAGSEGTAHTARSRAARTTRSGKRTPSAFSRRSRKSKSSRSRSAFGLGLEAGGGRDIDSDDEHQSRQDGSDPSETGSVVHVQRATRDE